ncbi:hypothetical protein HanRHA438_Chr12g0557111 [Helianthus annuus]|nr:hypothetical protein HanRHA438_Chr12g0557111 [Helianthus annuus]
MSFFLAEIINSIGGGHVSSNLFFYFSYVSIFLLIDYFLNLVVFFKSLIKSFFKQVFKINPFHK